MAKCDQAFLITAFLRLSGCHCLIYKGSRWRWLQEVMADQVGHDDGRHRQRKRQIISGTGAAQGDGRCGADARSVPGMTGGGHDECGYRNARTV